jgi:hypothetical protein
MDVLPEEAIDSTTYTAAERQKYFTISGNSFTQLELFA